jgi:uncharacterized protein
LPLYQIILLVVAGFIGGTMNAMAGGASLVTFPAFLACGIAPITANASNTVATSLFTLSAAITEWKRLPPRNLYFWAAASAALVGGLIGGSLLMTTDSVVFEDLVPILIALGTVLFAYAKRIQSWLTDKVKGQSAQLLLLPALLLPVCIYGGYFGAGLGVLVMATILSTSDLPLLNANALKNLIGPIANLAAVPVFLWHGAVEWLPTLCVVGGGLVGAQLGVKLFKTLNPATLRAGIITIGIAMSAIYAYRYWL